MKGVKNMKDVRLIYNATPDPTEVLTTFLDDAGLPRNVLVRQDHTKNININDHTAVATEAMKIHAGTTETVDKDGKLVTVQNPLPEFRAL
jgi:hypothetical protein